MPDIKSVIRQMMADGESEDVIDAVVKKMQGGSEIKSGLPDMSPELITPPRDEYRGPDTFWGGFKKSLFGDEFNQTAQKSLKGFAKGTADIPATIADTAQGLASGVHSLIEDPAAHFRAMPEAFREMGRGIRDVTKNAGADPEAFGHLSGQLFGQPAFTEGLIKAPAIAKATTGAINRIPAVNKTFSTVGKALEGTRDPKVIPASSRGLVAGAVRAVARPVGRALSRVGERGRLDAGTRPPSSRTNIKLKGETETPHSPDSDIFAGGGQGATRPRPIRYDTPDMSRNSEFTRPILESAEELAARKRPSVFTGGQSRRHESRPFEPRPLDTTPYPRPGAIPEGIPGEAPLVRDTTPYEPPPVRPGGLPPEPPPIDPFAAPANKIPLKSGRLKQNRRNQSQPYVPSVDPFAPPTLGSPIGVGEGGLSSRYQHRPYEPGQQAAANVENSLAGVKPKPAPPVEPLAPKFEPSVDPAATNLSPEDIALMKSRRSELRAALEKMAGGETVDPTTGEITNTPRTKGPWRQSEPDVNPNEFDIGPDESGVEFGPNDPSIANDAGRFADEVEATRYPGDEAFDLGEISPGFRQTSSMPDWGPSPRTIQPSEWGDWGGLEADIPTLVPDASGSHVAAPKVRPGVNPLRPEVPPGQVTNKSMFQNSEMRGTPQQSPGRQFAEQVLPHEFDPDMMFAPDELRQPDVPEFTSPFENPNDPRVSGLAPNEEMGFSGKKITDTADDYKGRDPVNQPKNYDNMWDEDRASFEIADELRSQVGEFNTGVTTRENLEQLAYDTSPEDIKLQAKQYGHDRRFLEQPPEHLEALKAEIAQTGKINKPIQLAEMQDGRLTFADGHTRLTAAKELGIAEIPYKIIPYSKQMPSHQWPKNRLIASDDILEGASEGFSTGANEEMGFSRSPDPLDTADNRLLEHPDGPAGEWGRMLARRIKSKLPREIEGTLTKSLDEYIPFAEKNPEYVQKAVPQMVKTMVDDIMEQVNWGRKSYTEFPEQKTHLNSLADHLESLAKDLEANPTPENIFRIKDELKAFEADKPSPFGLDFANDEGLPPPRLVKKGAKEKNFQSVVPDGFGKVGAKEVGPKGASYTIRDPNGKKLGDINVTPRDIAAHKAANEDLALVYDDNEIATMIYEERKGELLGKHGYYPDEPKIGIERKTTRTKDEQVPAEVKEPTVTKVPAAGEAQMMGQEPTYSEAPTTIPKTEKRPPKAKPVTKTKIPFEPNTAFGPNGDLKAIIQELSRLQRTNADDIKYAELLPDDLLDGPLKPGQTYQQKLQDAIKIVDDLEGSNARRNPEKETADWNERQQVLADLRNKLKIGELDDFVNQVIEMSRLDPEPIHAPLDPSKVDVTKLRKGSINQHSAKLWQSPKMQQQQNALFRERMGKPPKKAKDKKKAKWL